MMTLEEALQKFESLDPEVVFIVNSDRVTAKIAELSQKYGVDLNAAALLSVVGGIRPEELADYLAQEKEIDSATAKSAADELISQVLKPLETRLRLLDSNPDKTGITRTQEKEELRKIFSEELLWEMSENFLVKNALNRRIFDILESDLNFKRELERQMYENNELLTTGSINIAGKAAEPTIGNWLKDFIDKKGTDDFTPVVLSDYITNSENTRNLSKAERGRLFDLLNLYRNLKFFPGTTEGKSLENWQIFPFDQTEAAAYQKKMSETAAEETEVAEKAPAEEETTEEKLAQYDWSKITGIERRALLEELGIGLKDFARWQEKNK